MEKTEYNSWYIQLLTMIFRNVNTHLFLLYLSLCNNAVHQMLKDASKYTMYQVQFGIIINVNLNTLTVDNFLCTAMDNVIFANQMKIPTVRENS